MTSILAGNYLLLGSTGLTGTHTLLKLKNVQGVKVKAVYNQRKPFILADNIEYVQADLRDHKVCLPLMNEIDFVFLNAGILATSPVLAKDPISPVLSNLSIYTNCLEAAYRANVKKLVFLSSTTGYPEFNGVLKEEQMFEGNPPDSWYFIGWMTRFIETQCRTYSEKLNPKITIIILRPTMIYGEYDNFSFENAHFFPALIRRIVERQNPIEVWGNGEQKRDLVYAGDLVDAGFAALEKVKGFDCFNIAFGESYTINFLLAKMISIDGFHDAKIHHLENKPSSVSKRIISGEKAKIKLGFAPKISIEEGIKKTISWYRRQSL
jgi:GDP-L-fucose synthase